MSGEGKSFIAANLALSLANYKSSPVLLIDADMRRGTLHKLLGAPSEPGLTQYLAGTADLASILQRPAPEIVQRPDMQGLKLLPPFKEFTVRTIADREASLDLFCQLLKVGLGSPVKQFVGIWLGQQVVKILLHRHKLLAFLAAEHFLGQISFQKFLDHLAVLEQNSDNSDAGQVDEKEWRHGMTKTTSEIDNALATGHEEMHSRLLTKKQLSEMAWGVREHLVFSGVQLILLHQTFQAFYQGDFLSKNSASAM